MRGLAFIFESRSRRQSLVVGVASLLAIAGALTLAPLGVFAQSSQVNISQGYKLAGAAVDGTLVATDHSASSTVAPATLEHANDLVGVVIQAKESLLAVDSGTNQTQVATSGVAYALVSNINGEVKSGDRITASPLTGVGMKAVSASRVLGIAQSDLLAASGLQTVATKDKTGHNVNVKVGRILVSVNVGYYAGPPDSTHSVIPKSLQDISNALAGKQVSPIRVILSGLLLIIALIISIILVYAAVRSSIVSIGRNPLSQPAVRKGLAQVLGFVIVILLVTLIAVYLILSR